MIEIADVFRRFGGDYKNKYGFAMLPSHERVINDIINCRTKNLGVTYSVVIPVTKMFFPIVLAKIGTVQNAILSRLKNGWNNVRKNFYPYLIFTSLSRFQKNFGRFFGQTKRTVTLF